MKSITVPRKHLKHLKSLHILVLLNIFEGIQYLHPCIRNCVTYNFIAKCQMQNFNSFLRKKTCHCSFTTQFS